MSALLTGAADLLKTLISVARFGSGKLPAMAQIRQTRDRSSTESRGCAGPPQSARASFSLIRTLAYINMFIYSCIYIQVYSGVCYQYMLFCTCSYILY